MTARVLSLLAADAWATRRGLPPMTYERPDEVNRREQAIDLLGREAGGCPLLVLEHTLVESFINQRSAQIATIRMFEPLEKDLAGQLNGPGHFNFAVRPGAVLGHKQKEGRIRKWTAEWIRRVAPTLAVASPKTVPHHFATVTVPDTNMSISLSRFQGRSGHFGLVFEAPDDIGHVLAPSFIRAIDAKCPKLEAAKRANPGTTSLLLLEISDIALGNLIILDEVVQSQFISHDRGVPDDIWLVDTTHARPSVMISRESGTVGDVIIGRYMPFHLPQVGVDLPENSQL